MISYGEGCTKLHVLKQSGQKIFGLKKEEVDRECRILRN